MVIGKRYVVLVATMEPQLPGVFRGVSNQFTRNPWPYIFYRLYSLN